MLPLTNAHRRSLLAVDTSALKSDFHFFWGAYLLFGADVPTT